MSRDYLIKFKHIKDTSTAEKFLNTFYSAKDKIKIFKLDNINYNKLYLKAIVYE